jgi:ABC-2 type transport system permease protein
MPARIHGFTDNQAAAPVIETIRGLLLGTPVGANPSRAIAWCAGVLVVSVAVAASSFLFRRGTA